jgi:hypothetical protein
LTLRLYRAEGPKYLEHAVGEVGRPLRLTEPVQATLDPDLLDS